MSQQITLVFKPQVRALKAEQQTASGTISLQTQAPARLEIVSDGFERFVNVVRALRGAKGEKGDDGNAAIDYVHVQIDASASWMIAHNQNRYPQVTVINQLNMRIEPNVSYVDENIVLIEHATPTVGKAILS